MALITSFQWVPYSNPSPELTKNVSLTEILASTLIITLIFKYLHYWWQNRRWFDIASKIDGPTPWPIFGNALMFLGKQEGMLFHPLISQPI